MNQALRDLLNTTPDDAAALAACAADPRTVRPIPLDELRPLLTGLGIYGRLARAALADDTAANAYAYVSSSNQTIRSDQPDYAAQLDGMLAGLAPLGVTPDVAAAVVALGGGYLLRGVTADDVTAERAAMARTEALSALSLAHAAVANDRAGKLMYLTAHPDSAVPTDLAGLDAFAIPGN